MLYDKKMPSLADKIQEQAEESAKPGKKNLKDLKVGAKKKVKKTKKK